MLESYDSTMALRSDGNQALRQWSRLMQNSQKSESVLLRMEVTVNVNDALPITYKVSP